MIELVRGDLASVARTTMAHPGHDLKITLYPMYHVASPLFYESISQDLERFPVLLLEGVQWKGFRGRLHDLVARNLGLAEQWKALRLPAGAERISLDMSAEQFADGAASLPLHWNVLLRLYRPLSSLQTAFAGGRRRALHAFSKRHFVGGLQIRDDTPIGELIGSKRDRVMADILHEFACDERRTAAGGTAAVVCGAAHMPALYAVLRDCGYRKGNVRWFELLEGIRVPP